MRYNNKNSLTTPNLLSPNRVSFLWVEALQYERLEMRLDDARSGALGRLGGARRRSLALASLAFHECRRAGGTGGARRQR